MLFALLLANALVASHAYHFTHFDPAASTRPAAPGERDLVERLEALALGVSLPRPRHDLQPEDFGPTATFAVLEGLATWTWPGEGRGSVLLLHGFGGSAASLTDEARRFHDRGYTVRLVDLPGAGASPDAPTTLGWTEGALAAQLIVDLPRPRVIFGGSMGAAAALRAAGPLQAPVDALVLENPYDRLSTTVGHRMQAMGLPAQPATLWLLSWGGLLTGFNPFALDPVDFARQVKAPTLLLCGAEDPWVLPDEIASVHAALAGVGALHRFPGVGHRGLYAADPARWEAAVWPFLAEHAPPR